MKNLFFLIVALFTLHGCTNITIQEKDGSVTIQREFGFLILNANPDTDAIVAEITALGYMSSPMGVSVGYGKHSVALLPDSCRIVIWIEGENDLLKVKSIMGDNESICPIIAK